MLHFVMSYMKQNKKRKQTLESAQYGLEVIFNVSYYRQVSFAGHRSQVAGHRFQITGYRSPS